MCFVLNYTLFFNKSYMNNLDNNNFIITKMSDGVRFSVKVIPGSSKCELTGIIDNSLKIKLNVPPIEGKANEKCIKFLSKLLGVPKTSITIISGEKSRNKVLLIKGDPDSLFNKVSSLI